MRILVTGGLGFIGSNLTDALISSGHDVTIIDIAKKRVTFNNPKAKVYKVDIGDPSVADIFARHKPEAVFHLAAQLSVPDSLKDPAFDARDNIIASINLLNLAIKAGTKHFLFASSGGAIVGNAKTIPTPELVNADPISPYGISKQTFEYYLEAAKDHIKTTSLRFSNVYGPRQVAEGEGGVVAIFIERIIKNQNIKFFGNGSSTRDYVYVGDVVNAFAAALKSAKSGTYNIATGQETRLDKLWKIVQKAHGSAHDHTCAPERPGDIYRSALDPSKAAGAINWHPTTTLEDGIKKTYTWFHDQLKPKSN